MAKLRFHGDLYEDTNRVVNVSNASSSNPAAPGTASPGSSTSYARADHVHPAQTVPTKVSDLTNDSGFITTETDPTVPSWAKASSKPSYTASEVGALPASTSIPSKTSDLTNDSGFITTETDPTVPAWAKASSKPSYTASEVGALPANTSIPSKTSDLTNDSGFISTETDPTVPSWAKQSSKPTYTASEVGALPASTSIPSKTSDLTNDSGFITSTGPTMIVNASGNIYSPPMTIDKTFTEINNAITAGIPVFVKISNTLYSLCGVSETSIIFYYAEVSGTPGYIMTTRVNVNSNSPTALYVTRQTRSFPERYVHYFTLTESLGSYSIDGSISPSSAVDYQLNDELVLIYPISDYAAGYTDLNYEFYKCVRKYETYDSQNQDDIAHLEFENITKSGDIYKIKSVVVDCSIGTDDWSEATIIYTEKTIRESARIFYGTATSVVTSPQEGDICFVYTS